MELTDNLNIRQFKPLTSPEDLKADLPETDAASHVVAEGRRAVEQILLGNDKRRMMIVGPCSLHDEEATLDYARRLYQAQKACSEHVLIVMRAYFEKPRTTLGWKGMLYDPHLDGSYDLDGGIRMSRKLLCEISEIGLPAATEFLDPIVPQYLADMVTWAAIGARTTESQIHRQMASGLSMPIGFKNATDGNLGVAMDAIKSSSNPHSFLGIDRNGQVIIAETKGNKYGHLVMRGGTRGPNYASEYVAFAEVLLQKQMVASGLVVDCSHANSHKNHKRQREALLDIAEQIEAGNKSISGVMLESFLEEGNQSIGSAGGLKYGQSLTDKCIGWSETEELIGRFANAVASAS
ncbi:MAG: 3-deoxy-7-phosphoheptulonate synthase [Planctomycetota bacterium]|jgi:3-deoxy-7-phosphoheptulonate synthase